VATAGLTKGFDYSLTTSLFLGTGAVVNGEKGHAALQHALRIAWGGKVAGKTSVSNAFSHRLGIRYLFDSLFRVHCDENIFRTKVEYVLGKRSGISVESELITCLLENREWLPGDSGAFRWVTTASFLTPMVWNLAAGINFRLPETGSATIGISGARLTVVRDPDVFEALQTDVFNGVPRGQNHRFEYGLSLRLLADRTFWKILRWNCDLLVFKAYKSPLDLNVRNLLELKLGRLVVVSLQTRLLYDEEISRSLRTENLLSAGLCLRK
jgi:hypothetical protein